MEVTRNPYNEENQKKEKYQISSISFDAYYFAESFS